MRAIVQSKQFQKALSKTTELLTPLYKPLFVIYVLSTMIGLAVGSFSEFDVKRVGRYVFYALAIFMALSLVVIAIQSVYIEQSRRGATPNPHLRMQSQALKLKFTADGFCEFSERLSVISTSDAVSHTKEWNAWRGTGSFSVIKSYGGSVKNAPEFDHNGMDFNFTFDSPLQRGQHHEYGYTIRFQNHDGFIKRFMQRASFYAPEDELLLEMEEETGQPILIKRMTKSDVYRSPHIDTMPEVVCYRRYCWHVTNPQHGKIYEMHWEVT
jgi:hypothetical protein